MRTIPALLLGLMVLNPPAREPLRLAQTIPLEGVEGRIDHLAFDVADGRLFVAALGNNTVEAIDTGRARVLRSLPGFQEPQGIVVTPDMVAVANGEGEGVRLLRRDSLATIATVALGDDSDNVRYDERARRLYAGYGSGALAAIDPASGHVLGRATLAAHPESFQLERGGTRIFVNVPNARRIEIVDRTSMTVSATWAVTEAGANFPMALDEAGRRMFVGCRHPAVVLVLDLATGRTLESVPIVGDTDDLFFDADRQRLYVSGGEGSIDVLGEQGGRLARVARVATAPGARTSLFVPGQRRLYLAVPHRGGQKAEIRVFDVI